ncbi:MAG: TetR/AcrR family transcriptional regulator [Bacteroidota bacterium]
MNARPRSQDKLVDTALELFAENGYPAVTEEDLLKASKVSREFSCITSGINRGF